jgi:hemerythrin-like domain-containing protein
MKATNILVSEHNLILRALAVLDRVASRVEAGRPVPEESAQQLIDFFKTFADACHHAKEEGVLFPALEAAGLPSNGGPVAVMLHEHTLGRAAVRTMAQAVAGLGTDPGAPAAYSQAARAFSRLLSSHISKENGVLFPMAENFLAPEQDDALVAAFEEHERTVTGPGEHERFHQLIESLEKQYPS